MENNDSILLPLDTLNLIFAYVEDPYTIISIIKSCRTFRNIICRNENEYWKSWYIRIWKRPIDGLDQNSWKANFFNRYKKHPWGRDITMWRKLSRISEYRLYSAENTITKEVVAIRKMECPQQKVTTSALRELDVIQEIKSHPNIIEFYEVAVSHATANSPQSLTTTPISQWIVNDIWFVFEKMYWSLEQLVLTRGYRISTFLTVPRSTHTFFDFQPQDYPELEEDSNILNNGSNHIMTKREKKNLHEGNIKHLLREVLKALQHIHKLKVAHRNLKLEKIFINEDGTVKLGDFSSAAILNKHDYTYDFPKDGNSKLPHNINIVTLWYRPPELFLGLKDSNTAIDMWSFGCVVAELYLNQPFFMGNNVENQYSQICEIAGSPSVDTWKALEGVTVPSTPFKERKVRELLMKQRLPIEAINLIDKCLVLNPANRMTASEALESDYFKKPPFCTPFTFSVQKSLTNSSTSITIDSPPLQHT